MRKYYKLIIYLAILVFVTKSANVYAHAETIISNDAEKKENDIEDVGTEEIGDVVETSDINNHVEKNEDSYNNDIEDQENSSEEDNNIISENNDETTLESVVIKPESLKEYDLFNVSEQEEMVINYLMNSRDLSISNNMYILYNSENYPKFIMGISNEGYLIMDRDSFICIEWGGGLNPYNNYETNRLYYGGSLNYFVEISDGYYLNIVGNEFVSMIDSADGLAELGEVHPNKSNDSNSAEDITEKNDSNDAEISTMDIIMPMSNLVSTKRVANYYDYIQRKAFGYNVDGTCTAIATQLALNYLEETKGGYFVDPSYKSEYLTGNILFNGDTPNYPKSEAFHQSLYHDCNMGTATYANAVKQGIAYYRYHNVYAANREIDVDWSVGGLDSILRSIDNDIPAMVTTTFFAGQYNLHTMLVYGYKEYDDGTYELLCHKGWDGGHISSDGTNFVVDELWLHPATTTYRYTFSYTDELLDTSEFKNLTIKTDQLYKSATLKWDSDINADYYEIYRSTNINDTLTKIGSSTSNSFTDVYLLDGKSYYYKVCKVKKVTGYSEAPSTEVRAFSNLVSTALLKCPTLTARSWTRTPSYSFNQIELTWNEISGANCYEIYRSTSLNGYYSLIHKSYGGFWVDSTLSQYYGGTYYYKIRACNEIVNPNVYSEYSNIASSTTLETPNIKKLAATGNNVSIEWNKVIGATSYDIYKDGLKIANTTNTSYSGLTGYLGGGFSFSIQAKVGNSQSNKSYAKSITFINSPSLSLRSDSSKSLYLSWTGGGSALGYKIYRATSYYGTYSLIASTSAKFYTNNGLSAGSTYYYKIVAYNKSSTGHEYYSNDSTIRSATVR